ncbi:MULTISPECIES: arginase [unclassified Rhizobium]|uniref:arginase n=1 Tax=unclassified Rhizobium TaxID=2613769 RepID=UPI0006482806|nr:MULTISPECIES: arginase [unclassified Rhizobium]MBO9125849.1 arginase [Rhizobium sp. 16-488-2b]MBO9176433.1 arginase [Rhizobium sp. 16-488-2a]MBO9195452.1 arginase [Rhizobium sp. 16-449-1b]
MQAQSRSVTLIGAPLEEGSGRRGAAMGPTALRIAGVDRALVDLGHDVADAGDVQIVPARDLPNNPKAHNLRTVGAFTRALEAGVYEIADAGRFPIILGGDHSLSMGTVSGMARYAAKQKRPLFVLWLDAHSDFNTPETSPSGNIHGMPVAYYCGQADLSDILPRDRPLVDPKNVFQVGIRSVDAPERELIKEHGVNVFDMRSIDEQGVAAIMRDILSKVEAANALFHVSLDVDFLDPDVAPGVGTTVPGGATFREAHLIMEMLCDSGLVSSLDLVELNPFLDDRGKSARVLVELTASLFGRRIFDRPTRAA